MWKQSDRPFLVQMLPYCKRLEACQALAMCVPNRQKVLKGHCWKALRKAKRFSPRDASNFLGGLNGNMDRFPSGRVQELACWALCFWRKLNELWRVAWREGSLQPWPAAFHVFITQINWFLRIRFTNAALPTWKWHMSSAVRFCLRVSAGCTSIWYVRVSAQLKVIKR